MTWDGWMSVTEAAVRMRMPEAEVRAMAVAGELEHRVNLDHQEVSLSSVDAWVVAHRPAPEIRGGAPLTPAEELAYEDEKRDL